MNELTEIEYLGELIDRGMAVEAPLPKRSLMIDVLISYWHGMALRTLIGEQPSRYVGDLYETIDELICRAEEAEEFANTITLALTRERLTHIVSILANTRASDGAFLYRMFRAALDADINAQRERLQEWERERCDAEAEMRIKTDEWIARQV